MTSLVVRWENTAIWEDAGFNNMNTHGDPADLCLTQIYKILTHSAPQYQFIIKDKLHKEYLQ